MFAGARSDGLWIAGRVYLVENAAALCVGPSIAHSQVPLDETGHVHELQAGEYVL